MGASAKNIRFPNPKIFPADFYPKWVESKI